jgi:hypothetical protein
MVKKKAKKRHPRSELTHFRALRPYMARVAVGRLGRHQLFSLCVRASLSKCFEFNISARSHVTFDDAFFAISSLRGICEDLIVLRYIKQLPAADREALIVALSEHEMLTRINLQDRFLQRSDHNSPSFVSRTQMRRSLRLKAPRKLSGIAMDGPT